MGSEEEMYGRLDDYRADIEELRPIYDQIVRINSDVYTGIEGILRKYNLRGYPINVGSTNSNRLSCVVDPRQPEITYPSDFDIGIVIDSQIDDDLKRKILADALPEGKEIEVYGRIERKGTIAGFPISYTLVDENDRYLDLPLQYSSNILLDNDETEQVRMLRLFSMRNGLYGGFTGGIKGISLEQLVKNWGSFENVLSYFAQGDDFSVMSPVDGSNLLGSLRSGVLSRGVNASREFVDNYGLKLSPYSIGDWIKDHLNGENFEIGDESDEESFQIFRQLRSNLRDSCGKNGRKEIQRDLLLVPYLKSHKVYVSLQGDDREKLIEAKRKFLTKVNSRPFGVL